MATEPSFVISPMISMVAPGLLRSAPSYSARRLAMLEPGSDGHLRGFLDLPGDLAAGSL